MASPSPPHSPRYHYGSASPPPVQTSVVQPVISKRDKRRTALSNNLQDLTTNFNQTKDEHYRTQLSILNAEMRAITDTNCHPDHGGPLPDVDPDLEAKINMILHSTVAPGPIGDERPSRFYQPFISEVNEAVERRDMKLTELHVSLSRLG